MSTAVAFLSGKGGSGKTTLALSVADLLCRCGVQTLLVDCDLSTNGATYFYESQLVDQGENEKLRLLSFDGLLNRGGSVDQLTPLKIKPTLDFVPSISDISNQHPKEREEVYPCDPAFQLTKFVKWAKDNYEVILFDCQAGYAEFLPILLPLMNADLFVMEADSISASAMRSLHLKVGNHFGYARLYQIFNKATPEEFDIYSKIVGTFFTNIGTLLFDWRIRQAFSRSQIPDLENTSSQYSSDICSICKVIFPDRAVQERLEYFSLKLLRQKLEKEREEIEEKLYKRRTPLSVGNVFLHGFIAAATATALIALYESAHKYVISGFQLFAIFSVVFLMGALQLIIQNSSGTSREEQEKYKRKIKEIEKELEKIYDLQRGAS